MTATEGISLELDDIQSGALHERPSPYVGTYLLLRIDDRAAGRELVRRLHGLVDAGRPSADPARDAWITAAFTYQGLKALGVPQASLDSFAPEFRQGMAARAAELGDVGESSPEHWEKPLGSPDVHVALAAISPDAARLQAVVEKARRAHEELAGVELIWRQDCYQLPTGPDVLRLQGRDRPAGGRGQRQGALQPAGAPPQAGRDHPRIPGRDRASCRRCRRRTCSAATAPTSSSASSTRGWRPTGSTCARRARAARKRRSWAPRWSGAGRAAPRSRSRPSATTRSSAPTRSGTTTSSTATTRAASSARSVPTRDAPTRATRSTATAPSTSACTA